MQEPAGGCDAANAASRTRGAPPGGPLNPPAAIVIVPGVVCNLIRNPTFLIIMIPGVVCILIPNPTFLIITITGDMCSLDHFFAWPLLPHWIRIHVAEYLLLSG